MTLSVDASYDPQTGKRSIVVTMNDADLAKIDLDPIEKRHLAALASGASHEETFMGLQIIARALERSGLPT